MKILKKLTTSTTIASMIVGLLTPLAVLVPQVSAATLTWTGLGADNNFSTAENWSGSVVPSDGDSLVFDVSVLDQNITVNNDIENLSVAGINRAGDSGLEDQHTFTLEGNGLILTGPIANLGSEDDFGQLRTRVDFTLGADIAIENMSNIFLDAGSFNLSTYSIIFENGGFIRELTGSGNITNQSGNLTIFGDPDNYMGTVTISGGELSIGFGGIGPSGTLVVEENGSLATSIADFNTPLTIGKNSSLSTASLIAYRSRSNTDQTVTFSGGLTLTSNIDLLAYANVVIEEPFEPGDFTISLVDGSVGSLTLPDGETVEVEEETITIDSEDKTTGSVTVFNKQTLILNGERGSISVRNGGILKGNGSVTGQLAVLSGGIVAPGLSPGVLTAEQLSLFNGSTYEFEIAGGEAGEYDQIIATESVEIDNAILEISFLDDFIPAPGDEFIIIDNQGDDPVTGTFDGLDEGDTIEIDGVTFRISYEGGDGNDVVLSVVSLAEGLTPTNASDEDAPGAPDTGVGTLLTSPFSALLAVIFSLGAVTGMRKIQTR